MNPTERWIGGMKHDERSLNIFEILKEADWKYNNDYFCWKSGGDGDNGEILMYALDCYFEEQDQP